MSKSAFVRTTPERLWSALTTPGAHAAILVRQALRECLETGEPALKSSQGSA